MLDYDVLCYYIAHGPRSLKVKPTRDGIYVKDFSSEINARVGFGSKCLGIDSL